MNNLAGKDWTLVTVGLSLTLTWSDRAAAETQLDFDLPVALAQAETAGSVPPANGLSFQLPPAPPEPLRSDPAGSASLLPVPAANPPLSPTVAARPLPPAPGQRPSQPKSLPAAEPAADVSSLNALFAGDRDSLVARAVGSAEGTRTATGQLTAAYYGHRDPGNQVWNLGTFSYQHGADSPEAADVKQLARLRRQAQQLEVQAAEKSMALSKAEWLNGIDLANQAPVTALEWGYIDRLHQAKTMGLQGEEAILWARTRAFLDPDSGRWNAPGLGNTVQGISRDQSRRMGAIAQAIEHSQAFPPRAEPAAAAIENITDIVINLDLR